MREVMDDLRYALRQLRRTPNFTAVAILTLALGIGANTTFYALTDAIFWRPFRQMRIARVYDVNLVRPARQFVPGQPLGQLWRFKALTDDQLAHVAADPAHGIIATASVSDAFVVLQTPKGAVGVVVTITRGNYAAVYGMQPLIGQLSGLGTDGAQAGLVVVISEAVWRNVFQNDPAIVGRETLRLNGRPFTVAGVARREQSPFGSDIWVSSESWRSPGDGPGATRLSASLVRLRTGVEPARITPMIDASLAAGPTPPAAEFKTMITTGSGPRSYGTQVATYATVLIGLSTLVLLAACANLANMLYARAAQRTGEIAVRMSLGAGTARIFRLFLLEAALVAAAAAGLGVAMALATLRWVRSELPNSSALERFRMPFELTPDWRIFAWALAAGALSAVVVGGLTAWRGSRTPPLRMFGASGIAMSTPARGKWLRTLMVAVQVSAAVILLLGTGLYLVRAVTTPRAKLNFDTSPLATAQLTFDERFSNNEVVEIMASVLDRVGKIDGVDHAAIADGLIGGSYSGGKPLRNLVAEDESMPGQMSGWRRLEGQQAAVSSDFLKTIGVELLRGRAINPNDGDGAPEVVMLSRSAVESVWPGLDPIGRRVRLGSDPRWFTVVGVFADPARKSTDTKWSCDACVAFTPWAQKPGRSWLIVLRASAPAAAAEQVVRAVASVNEDVPVFNPSVAARSIFVPADPRGLAAQLVGGLGLLSLAIAALGVYGVISYSVSRRTREFGIRLALGATPRGILRAVLDDAVHLLLIGLLPGVLLASWSTRVLEASIVSLMPNDIPTWAAVPIIVMAIGVFAAYIPARRAARVDPNVALRDL
ncbi:MAG TPA: ABC transporter permease [Vicinamibacterales bacterium]|nr:ABC transporter permease [Vicinamibacterales bacterium]